MGWRQMCKTKWKHGKCAKQFERYYPGLKDKLQFGTAIDNLGDQGPVLPIYDIDLVYLTSVEYGDTINGQVTIAGVLPTNEEINAIYSFGFDIDNNIITGVAYARYQGIDRIVYINATGNIGLGTFTLTGEIEDTHLSTTVPLPEALIYETEDKFIDFKKIAIPVATSFLSEISKTMLNLSAAEVPVVATAGDNLLIYDTAGFVFDSERWLKDPTLTTFGTGVPTPGKDYLFEVSGLKPNSPFKLYLDDTLMLSGMLDGSGSYSGKFVFPSNLPNTIMYFLTAQDETGEFAYNITCPELIPPNCVGGFWIPVNKFGFLAP